MSKPDLPSECYSPFFCFVVYYACAVVEGHDAVFGIAWRCFACGKFAATAKAEIHPILFWFDGQDGNDGNETKAASVRRPPKKPTEFVMRDHCGDIRRAELDVYQ